MLIIAIALFLLVAARAAGGWREAYAGFAANGNTVSDEEINTTYHTEEIGHHPQTTNDITEMPFDERYPQENAPMLTNPHPFAAALMEYMAGYDGVVRAYLATLDDDGTMGVLTTRPATRFRAWDDYENKYDYFYGRSGVLFYIQDGDVLQIDVSCWWLFVAGRYNRLMVRIYGHTHIVEIIHKLEFGRLETSTRLQYFSDEYLSYLFDGDYDAVAELIAERDAQAEYAREKYGLVALPPPNFGHMQNTDDQTAQILAMTINCAPSLAMAADYHPN